MDRTVPPSRPGYEFSSADLARAEVPREAINRMIGVGVQQMQQTGESPPPEVLLASIAQKQAVASVRYRIYPFNLATGRLLQILPENLARKSLLIQFYTGAGLGNNVAILLEQGPTSPAQFDQGPTDSRLNRCLRISTDTNFPNPFQFFMTPVNPVTLITDTDSPIAGVIIEGV